MESVFFSLFLYACLSFSLSLSHSFYPSLTQPSRDAKMLISVSDKQTMRNGGPMASLSLSFDLCVLYCSLRPVFLLKASMKPQPQAFHIQFVVYQKHDDQLQEQRVKGSNGFTISFWYGLDSVNSQSSDTLNSVNMFLAHIMMTSQPHLVI